MPTMLADKDFLSEAMTNMNRECIRLREENTKLRKALEACRQHVRHNHNSGSWWNDPRVWDLMRKHIDPALGVETRE